MDLREQFARRDLKGAGQRVEVQYADVPLSALERPNVCPVETRRFRQSLLRESGCEAELSDLSAEAQEDLVGGYSWHLGSPAACSLSVYRL